MNPLAAPSTPGARPVADGPTLSRAGVDRDAATRDDPAALEVAWAKARVLVVEQGRALVDEADRPRLVLLDPGDAPDGARLYLGRDDEHPYFAVEASLGRKLGSRALDLREVGALLDDRDAGLLVHTVALTAWHRTHVRCPRCGEPTAPIRGGAVRRCISDGSEHFPRTDPAMIVLVHDGADRCILGRQAVWPPGRFSTLAGFVEPGESAEQAVVREVAEECGVAVTQVEYVASQPWPFPSSLMLGFSARCDPDAQPAPVDGELEDAQWFTRDELREAVLWDARPTGRVQLPPPVSIASLLIRRWVESA